MDAPVDESTPTAAKRLQQALGVLPVEVVDEDRHRREAVERGVWSPVIVGPQPAAEGSAALDIGAVGSDIGPLLEQGLVEPLHLPVGLRAGRVR